MRDLEGGAALYDPDDSTRPYTKEEAAACQHERPSPVMVGQRVLYRHEHHGDVTDALVVDLLDDYPKETVLDNGMVIPLPPWPLLTLETVHGQLTCRESRARGAAGWLPVTAYDGIAV